MARERPDGCGPGVVMAIEWGGASQPYEWGADSCEASRVKPDSPTRRWKDDDQSSGLVANRCTSCRGMGPPVQLGMLDLVDRGGWGTDAS